MALKCICGKCQMVMRAWFGMLHHMYTCMYDKSHLPMCKTVLFLAHTSPQIGLEQGLRS